MPPKRLIEVWMDEDLCTGCGKCVERAPAVFTHVNGAARVMEAGRILLSGDIGLVPIEQTDSVLAAAQNCPSGIILVDFAHLEPGGAI